MTLTIPPGAIRTIAPWGQPFDIRWDAIGRWHDEIEDASGEFAVPAQRIAAHIVIESGGDPRAKQVNPTNGTSYGLMQVVPYGVGWEGWHALVGSIAGIPNSASNTRAIVDALYEPMINLRVGAAILSERFDQYGNWDRASSAYFLGNPDWRGADTINGNTGAAYRTSLNELVAEIAAATETPMATKTLDDIYEFLIRIDSKLGAAPTPIPSPPAPPPPTNRNPFQTPIIYTLAQHYALFGLTKKQADKIINNRFENRNGGDPRFIVNHIQDGTTRGSLNWWATGAGVQASSTVMVNKDGSILQVVPEEHGPWTNGDVNNPTEKSAALRALGGNPNNWSLSLEAEGTPGITSVSYTPEQLNAVCWQNAEWMIAYDIPLKNVLSHASINFRDRASCPGNANMLKILDELKKAGFE